MHDFHARRVEGHLQQLLEGHPGAIEQSRLICRELRHSLLHDLPLPAARVLLSSSHQSPDSTTASSRRAGEPAASKPASKPAGKPTASRPAANKVAANTKRSDTAWRSSVQYR